MLTAILDSLLQGSLPMIRLHRLHTRWELPFQKILVVHDPARTVFRQMALERGMHLVAGTMPQRIVCLQTVHHIPVRDLAIAGDGSAKEVGYGE
jgi:hypothetical protein